MSDIYIPGIRSRLNSDQIVQDLMQVERIPRDRVVDNVDRLAGQRAYWTDLGSRMRDLRGAATSLYAFQNPFNERIVNSSDNAILTGTATRNALEQNRTFIVKQIASADRFLSQPLEESYRVPEGTYTYTVGRDEISFNFRGGTLREFTDALNRRGQDKLQASLIAVRSGTRSLLIESRVTGAENQLGFSNDALTLGREIGMAEPAYDTRHAVDADISVNAGNRSTIPINPGIVTGANLVLRFETLTSVRSNADWQAPQPPPGPSIPSPGSVSYGGILIENEPSQVDLPPWNPPQPPSRVDNMSLITLNFSDGTSVMLPAIRDSNSFNPNQFNLEAVPAGKLIVSIDINNNNTHRDVSIRNIEVYDPEVMGGLRPLNAVSRAQDAIILMEGIEIQRSTNLIDDIIPGLTLNLRSASERPVNIEVIPDREAVKDSIITLVGYYNRLMAEINILTARNIASTGLTTEPDLRIIDELTYLTSEERQEYRNRLGVFQSDSTLNQLRNMLQRTASSPYPTSMERDLALLSQIGIGTDVLRGNATSGYDPSRFRGYLQINERELDNAIETKLPAIRELFGFDSDGDLLADTGVAFNLDSLIRPYVETGGIISLKTGTIDSRVSQEQRRIENMDRQLASREADLRMQYARMEAAFAQMERMSQSFDNFNQQFNNNR